MISQITLDGFNSQNTTYTLGQNILLLGPRGSGKSSVWKAIQFVLQSIPSANLPKEFDVHYDQGSGTEKFSATLTLDDGQIITRELSRNAKGEVKQKFLVGGVKQLTKIQEATFLQDLNIVLPNIESFLELSDQKKIAHLFSIFPCEINVERVSSHIDKSRDMENELQRKVLGKREAIQSLEEQLEASPVPSGATIEMLQGEIAKIESTIKDYEQQFREEEWTIQERQRVFIAEEEAKRRETQARLQAETEAKQKAREKKQEMEEEILRREMIAAEKAKKKAQEEARLISERLEEENRGKILLARLEGQEEAKRGIETRPEFAFPDESNLTHCQICLTELSEIIEQADKPIICYACKAEQMSFPGLIQLKLLRRRIKKEVKNES